MSYTPQNAPRQAAGRVSVIVKLRESAPRIAAVSPGGAPDAEPLWRSLGQRYPGVIVERGLQGVSPELVERAQREAGGPERVGADLNHFYRLRLPAGARANDVVDFVRTGNNRELVATAYVDAGVMPAKIDPTNDPLFSKQTYIRGRRGNKRGIYANFAWAKPGGDGSGIGIVFVEMALAVDPRRFVRCGHHADFGRQRHYQCRQSRTWHEHRRRGRRPGQHQGDRRCRAKGEGAGDFDGAHRGQFRCAISDPRWSSRDVGWRRHEHFAADRR